MSSREALAILALAASTSALLNVDAYPQFVARVPNANSIAGVQALGHRNTAGGGALNPFGAAFEAQGAQWTTLLCQADSDGDGATNGEELGDPCCLWSSGGQLQRTGSQVSHPGVANAWTREQIGAMACQEAAVDSGTGRTDNVANTATTLAPADSLRTGLAGNRSVTTQPSASSDNDDDQSIDLGGLRETPPSLMPKAPSPSDAPTIKVTPAPSPTSGSERAVFFASAMAFAVLAVEFAL